MTTARGRTSMLLFTKKENTAMPATSWREEFPDNPHFFGERLDAARKTVHNTISTTWTIHLTYTKYFDDRAFQKVTRSK